MIRRTPILLCFIAAAGIVSAAPRPMTFLDVLKIRSVQDDVLSSDGRQFAFTMSSLDWKSGKRFTELFVTDTATGQSRRMTHTLGKTELSPAFSMDSASVAYLSNRSGSNQLYLLPLDGGEARLVSTIPEPQPGSSVTSFAFSRDGRWLAYRAGRPESSQIYLAELGTDNVRQWTRHTQGVQSWQWTPDSTSICFTSPDERDPAQVKRMKLGFDVRRVDPPGPPIHLWRQDLKAESAGRLTSGTDFTIRSFDISRDGLWVSFLGRSTDRYAGGLDGVEAQEPYLLNLQSGKVEALTTNKVPERSLELSPDGKWIAFVSSESHTPFRRSRAWVRAVTGGPWRALPAGWDGDVDNVSWSVDSRHLYFTGGIGLNQNIYAIDLDSGELRPLTDYQGVLAIHYSADADRFVVRAEDPRHPRDFYLAAPGELKTPVRWVRLSNANPEVADFELGQYEAVRWKSSDGHEVEGVLVKPVGYESGKKYPLIVQIHGGPASAMMNSFSQSYGTYVHVFAAGGYAVLQPNYRGSTNYGERFRMQIAGDYFRQGFDDIMTGVDALVARGIADPDKLGMMGWSAGGHWSNWTLTHTDRFKAISSGAGAVNWISMYAQTDMQANREFYFKGRPWENWDHYVAVSPLRYIQNAKTPTLIQVGQEDPRVPRPQSEELYMALKKLGVPVEFLVYPRMGHGLTEPRYQMVKMAAEYGWFEKWIKGKKDWLNWNDLLETVPN